MKTLADLVTRAQQAIYRDELIIYDAILKAHPAHIVNNVKHMQWFTKIVIQEIIDTDKSYSHLILEDK